MDTPTKYSGNCTSMRVDMTDAMRNSIMHKNTEEKYRMMVETKRTVEGTRVYGLHSDFMG